MLTGTHALLAAHYHRSLTSDRKRRHRPLTPADWLVLNTGSVTEDAERASHYVIRKTLKHSSKAFIAVTGCDAHTGPEGLRC
ncbi:MAG: hypothetical protein LKG23_15290 [Nitrospira sp.]|nr:hypothetical protein [Nitrospira sp.]